MSSLTEELKREHEIVVTNLAKVKQLGIASKEARKILFETKAALLAHLKKEDDRLYPPLINASHTDDDLGRIVESFIKDMQEVSVIVLDFFSKYQEESTGMEFAKDYGYLIAKLGSRIHREENILYKRYDELFGNS
ncbi:MAG: hemerythrin domain-containing protein [Leptospiraceae bacterium]|nr:hemerythrin domain-containing protein [Leptospiraceae bacterium]